MKIFLERALFAPLYFFSFCAFAQESPTLSFNKNIELIGYIIHLGDPADNDPSHPVSQALNRYPADRENPLLFEIFELAADIPYSTIIELFYSLPEFPLPNDYELPERLSRWVGYRTPEEIQLLRQALAKTSQFARQSAFEAVWTSLQPTRQEALATLAKRLPSAQLLNTMEDFYGQTFKAYRIVPSLTIWPTAGWGIKSPDGDTASYILGPPAKNFDFTDTQAFLNLAVHEFGHSFVNDVVTAEGLELIPATDTLYAPIRTSMTRQGYSNWSASVYEHFVRAGEVIIQRLLEDEANAQALLKNYAEDRQFIYLPFIIERLGDYRLAQQLTYAESVKRTLQDLKATF